MEINLEKFKKEKEETALINYLSSDYNTKDLLLLPTKSNMNFIYGRETFKNEENEKIPIESFNSKIVIVLGQNILSTMHEYFDEIFEALMEDLLQEEVNKKKATQNQRFIICSVLKFFVIHVKKKLILKQQRYDRKSLLNISFLFFEKNTIIFWLSS